MTDGIPMKIYSRTFSSLFSALVVGALLSTASVFAAETQADLDAKMKEAKTFYDQGKSEEAFQNYIWCYDHGVEIDPKFVRNRDTRVTIYLVSIGKKFPPARAALVERRDALATKVKDAPKKADEPMLRQLAYLDLALGDDAAMLEMLALFPAGKTSYKAYGSVVQERLVEKKHYKEAVAADDFDEMSAGLEKMVRDLDKLRRAGAIDEKRAAKLKTGAIKASPSVEMYAGVGDLKRAKQITILLVNMSDDPEVRQKLVERLRRGGAEELAASLEAMPKK